MNGKATIVCGDLNVFTEGKGYNNVDRTVKAIFEKIRATVIVSAEVNFQ